MSTDNNLVKYDRVVKELRSIYEKKNRDYGDSFTRSLDKHGLVAFAVRAGDKMERVEKLITSAAKVDESVEDTIRDLANYAIMAVMWLKDDR